VNPTLPVFLNQSLQLTTNLQAISIATWLILPFAFEFNRVA
jgi:hypothetical protein